jgi:hypothetical protein
MSTKPRNIMTPFGPQVGMVWESLQILGISSFLTQTLNQPNDFNLEWQEIVDIAVPVGTLVVVPTVNFLMLAHGTISPPEIDPLDDNQTFFWNSADHNWGLGWAQVRSSEVFEPDFSVSPPTQRGQLEVIMHLSDYNEDDPWFGMVGYTLTFLGQVPTPVQQRGPIPFGAPVSRQEQSARRPTGRRVAIKSKKFIS